MKRNKHKQVSNNELKKYISILQPLIEKVVTSLGFRLLSLSFTDTNQTNCLCLTIVHENHLISLSDCESVSRKVEEELDQKDLIPFSYMLEVQSPGVNEKENTEECAYEFSLEGVDLVVKS